MKATKPIVLTLLLILGLTGLALGRDMGANGGGTPAASYGQNKHRGRHHRGRHHRGRRHNRGRHGKHKHGGMKM